MSTVMNQARSATQRLQTSQAKTVQTVAVVRANQPTATAQARLAKLQAALRQLASPTSRPSRSNLGAANGNYRLATC